MLVLETTVEDALIYVLLNLGVKEHASVPWDTNTLVANAWEKRSLFCIPLDMN